MNAMRIVALSGLWMIVAACAGTGSSGGPAAAQGLSSGVAPDGDAQPSAEIAELREVAVPESTGSPDDVICRREVRTGSHFATRVCRTRAEIEAAQQESQEFLRERQSLGGAVAGAEGTTQ